MKKSKEFIIERDFVGKDCAKDVTLYFLKGSYITTLCHTQLRRYFGLMLKLGQRKRIKITIEEIKK